MSFRVCTGSALWWGLLLAACNPVRGPEKEPQPISMRTGLEEQGPSTKLEVGEDCTQYPGSTGCKSGLCLRVAPGLPPRGFCSIQCIPDRVDNGCPNEPGSEWRCAQLWPTEQGWFCVPGASWTSRAATYRGGAVVARVPAKRLSMSQLHPSDGGLGQ